MKLRSIKYLFFSVVIVAAAAFGFMTWKKMFEVKIERTHQALTNQVLQVAELTAIKNSYSDIISIKKSAAGGMAKSYAIIKFSGVIRIGVEDLTKSKVEISPDGKSVEITIQHCSIIDNTLVSQEVFDEKKSLFVPITTQEIFDEINMAMADYGLAAERNGLVKEADERLVELVTATVKGFGFEKVQVKLN
ncbi:MAG: DUF4230 domain-containing protein [Spirochaetales bacterium]|nr:DUF4230 domain-containing protein [Spirochaetales bacterium]